MFVKNTIVSIDPKRLEGELATPFYPSLHMQVLTIQQRGEVITNFDQPVPRYEQCDILKQHFFD